MYEDFKNLSGTLADSQADSLARNKQWAQLYKDLENTAVTAALGGAGAGAAGAAGGAGAEAGGASSILSMLGLGEGDDKDDIAESLFVGTTRKGTSVSDGKNVVNNYMDNSVTGGKGVSKDELAQLYKGIWG